MQIGPFHLSSSAHRLACSNRRMKEKAGCLYAVCLKSDGTVPTKYFTISAQGFQCRTPGIPAFPANFPFAQCHPCAEREGLSAFSERFNQFKHGFLFGLTSTRHKYVLFTYIGMLEQKLTAERKKLSRRYSALRDEVKEVEQIRKGVYSILREENRKEQPAHKQDLERWKTATQRVKCPAWPTALCLSHHNRTNGLIRSAGLSFISISAGSTFFNPWNLCVMSFSG